jgi:hypothetical protein
MDIMKRFRVFFNREVIRERLDDTELLTRAGLKVRYLPEVFEDFDEMEFLAPLEEGKDLVVSMALEQGKIMRLMLGWVGPDDPEDEMRSLDEGGVQQVLERYGDALTEFLKAITA